MRRQRVLLQEDHQSKVSRDNNFVDHSQYVRISECREWSYNDQDEWGEIFPTCSPSASPARQQSPIDVALSTTRDLTGRLRMANYALNVSLVQINTGHGGC